MPLLVWGEPNIFPSKCFVFLIKSIARSFILNTIMESENKRLDNISIPFVILLWRNWLSKLIYFFFLKYINKRNNPLPSKSMWKYLVIAKYFRSEYMASTKPTREIYLQNLNIYVVIGVAAFPIICHVIKRQCKCNNIN